MLQAGVGSLGPETMALLLLTPKPPDHSQRATENTTLLTWSIVLPAFLSNL